MKANKIFTEQNYNDAKKSTDVTMFQNINNCYIKFGTYGASIFYTKKNKMKIVNDWKRYSYKDLCKQFDLTEFED